MPRENPTAEDEDDAQQEVVSEVTFLRKRSVDTADLEATPTKRRRSFLARDALLPEASPAAEDGETADDNGERAIAPAAATTPRRRGRPPRAASQTSTPSKTPARSIFATPVKRYETDFATPKRRAADRSARKKSARALIENVVGDGLDSDDEDADDDVLVREIYEDADADAEDDAVAAALGADATPSKTGRKRGKPPKPPRSPTPPRDLPPHELYFTHNKPGRPKTSDNTLGSLAMLTHDEYFSITNGHVDRHAQDVQYLEDLHAELFPQWMFELSQGFSICLYGFGSKRRLLHKFAKHLPRARERGAAAGATAAAAPQMPRKTIVVNGYAPTATIREILTCVGAAVDPSLKPPSSSPAAMLSAILAQLSLTPLGLTILVNSIDAGPLRKPGTQSILSQLASHPQVSLVCSADTPDFALLWDIGIRSAFNFLFHDCTTFAPFSVELDVVDEVHELLGRNTRRVNGREGVAFVLKSLPENAKNLFQLLVGEVLVAMEDEGASRADEAAGLEYRMVYNKAVEDFICSSEMAFRTLLKEFHDHQMITSRKDALGTELLSVPFDKEELEAILDDLTS